jgi:nitrite reductase/ring-hydroxylating ferredoxin subunit
MSLKTRTDSLRSRSSSLKTRTDPSKPELPRIPITRLPQPRVERMAPTWRMAKPGRIARSLDLALSQNSGGWFVAGVSGDVGRDKSVTRTIAGREIVLWRDSGGELVAGPGACPHLGALLDRCAVVDGTLFCRWHGLALDSQGDASWKPYVAHDDGVLIWVRLPTAGEEPTERPSLPPRPPQSASVAAVMVEPGRCQPEDVIANRLDPWHGAWFHPYAFSHLDVDDEASDETHLVVDVAFRLSATWGVPVRAEFSCPDARTIVMRIIEGEGVGSVVETHATPLGVDEAGDPVTMITEATIAYSERPGFQVARWMGALVKPAMKRTARKLWVDDLAYAERRYELRMRGEYPG